MRTPTNWDRFYDAWSTILRGDFAQGQRDHAAYSFGYAPAKLGTFATGQARDVHLGRVEVDYAD
jgi:hypothetical protein